MKSNVLNSKIGLPYDFTYPELTSQQEQEILAGLFEQLLLFDKITISTGRLNFALYFLIKKLGFEIVERLLDSGYINFMIYSPLIFTQTGRKDENGKIDQSVIYGQPPIISGSFSQEDLDPEKNINYALSNFSLSKKYARQFTKKAAENYFVPDGMQISSNSEKLIIDAYVNNNLANLGLPYDKEPTQLDLNERKILLQLGHKVIETSILANFGLKSYENYEHLEICKQNIANIGKAFNVADNTSEILKIENVPNLKELYLSERMDFESVFKIRHLSTAKYYRKWINTVGENSNIYEVTAAYLNEIKGKSSFFEKTKGKFIKNLGSFAIRTGLTALIAAKANPASLLILQPAVDYTLGLLENFWLDDLLKGKNPSMFVEDIKKELKTSE